MEYWTKQQLDSIHKMLNPRSIAVVGATERMQYGGRFLNSVLSAKDKVNIYPVNPRYDELMGVPCYPSVSELPESPDLVGVIVPYHRVIPVIKESAEKGAGSAVVISAGFAERGDEERRELQLELGRLGKETGVRFSGPNCLGLANVKDGIWPCASSSLNPNLSAGRVGLVCQSGASAFGPFVSRAINKGLGYSYIVSTGNEADLEASDFVRYLLDDDHTKVIAVFIEGFKNAKKFLEVAKLAAEKGKPIVAVKIGRSELGAKAAQSHTAALTGTDEAYDAAFEQYGVIRVHDWDKLLEVSQLLAYSLPPKKQGIALVSHSGGVCSLTADNLGQAGIDLPELTDKARDGINEILEGFGWAANPADITGHASRDTLAPIMDYMVSEPEVGGIVVASSGSEGQAQHIINLREKYDGLISFLYTGNELSNSGGLKKLREADIPVFLSPENLAFALKSVQDYYSWRNERLESGFASATSMSEEQRGMSTSLPSSGGVLTEYEAKRLINGWGIPITKERQASTVEEALAAAEELSYPVVLKVDSPDILHKTEAGALKVSIGDEASLRQAYDEILGNASKYDSSAQISGVLVQEMVAGGTEVIIGVKQDVQLGPVLLFGTGGIFVEVMKDVAMKVCPITPNEAESMIRSVRGFRLLEGFRGQAKGDVPALVDALVRISHLAVNLSDKIAEIDINPLVVLPEGQGVKALDALVTLRENNG